MKLLGNLQRTFFASRYVASCIVRHTRCAVAGLHAAKYRMSFSRLFSSSSYTSLATCSGAAEGSSPNRVTIRFSMNARWSDVVCARLLDCSALHARSPTTHTATSHPTATRSFSADACGPCLRPSRRLEGPRWIRGRSCASASFPPPPRPECARGLGRSLSR